MGVLVRADSAIHTAKDLKGKTIATPALHSLGTTGASAWIDQNGGDSSAISYVEIPFPQMADALRAKQVDAAMINEPFLSLALHTHGDELEAVGWPLSQTAPSGVVSQYVSTQRVIADRHVYADFLDALSAQVAGIETGDPLADGTRLSAMITGDEAENELAARYHAIAEAILFGCATPPSAARGKARKPE